MNHCLINKNIVSRLITLKSNASPYTAVSLFSGCGGLDIGAKRAGINVEFATDCMLNATKTLETHLPDTDIVHSTIQNVTKFPKTDFLIGGYPCQSFSMGGRRKPSTDARSDLYLEYFRALNEISPLFFVAENVAGLKQIEGGKYLEEQLSLFEKSGSFGYNITWQVLNAADYGVPQNRKRLFIVGVRKDLGLKYRFPSPTHGKNSQLIPFTSHGEIIKDLPLWPEGEFYERPDDDGTFSWYYMSRNRKAKWGGPAYTVVANWRHTTLHPASPIMKLTWSDLKNGFKQRWDFSNEYEHLIDNPDRPVLEKARRLSWRESALIQTFPKEFEPYGDVQSKITQIGNAVPPDLARAVFEGITTGTGLIPVDDVELLIQNQ